MRGMVERARLSADPTPAPLHRPAAPAVLE